MRKYKSIDCFDDPELLDEDFDFGLQSNVEQQNVKLYIIALIDPDTGEIIDEVSTQRKVFDDIKILY
jgi:hypothetical protein